MITQSLQTKFDASVTPPVIEITDTTDYSQFGITPADVAGVLIITSPVGGIHSNTDYNNPDIEPGTTDEFSVALPLDIDGNMINGLYDYVYNTRYNNSIIGVVTSGSPYFEIAGDFTSYIGSEITIVNSTGNDGDYAVISVSLVGGNTRVFVSSISDSTVDGDLCFYQSKSVLAALAYGPAPTVSIEQSANCNCAEFTSQDTSAYTISYGTAYTSLVPTSISRVHTVKYPAGINPAKPDIVSSNATITTPDLYTTTFWSIIETELEYTLPTTGSPILKIKVYKSCSFDVVCSLSVCEVSSCLRSLYDKYADALRTGYIMMDKYQTKMIKATSLYVLYSLAVNCGDESAAQDAANQLKGVAESDGCNCGCKGQDCDPVQILPLCGATSSGSGGVVVQSLGNGITVQSATVGSTTTYTLSVNYSIVSATLAATNNETTAGIISNKFVSPATLKHWWESSLVGANRVVVTDGFGKFVGLVIGTAHNKNFGVNAGDVPEIESALAVGRTVHTSATGKLITVPHPYQLREVDYTASSTSSTTEVSLKTVVVPAGELSANGQQIRLRVEMEESGYGESRIYIGSSGILLGVSNAPFFNFYPSLGGRVVELIITRTGAAEQKIEVRQIINIGMFGQVVKYSIITAANIMANTLTIDITGRSPSGAGTVTLKSFMLEVFK